MTQAEELLESINTELYTVDPDIEEHIVISDARVIMVPNSLKRIGIQYDHNIETVTFDCPRYWDGIDMSTMRIYVNYMRADRYRDMYYVGNVTIDEKNTDIMHFNWTISRNVTLIKGVLSFLVCIKKTDEDGNEELHWNTELNQEMYIAEGLECEEAEVSTHPDIITDLLTRMETVEQDIQDTIEGYLKDDPDKTLKGYVEGYLSKNPAKPSEMQNYVDTYMSSESGDAKVKTYVDRYLSKNPTTPAKMQEYVNTYLSENPLTLDKTLSVEGLAADAAATSEALRNQIMKDNSTVIEYREWPELWTYGDVSTSDRPTIVIEDIPAGNYMLNGDDDYEPLIRDGLMINSEFTYENGNKGFGGWMYNTKFTGQVFTFEMDVVSCSITFTSSTPMNLTNISFKCIDDPIKIVRTDFKVIENSNDGKIRVMEVDGKSEQFSTTGAQLFDKNNATYVQNVMLDLANKKFTNNTGPVRMYYVAAEPNTTYTYSKTIGSLCRICSCPEIPAVGGSYTYTNSDTTQGVATITTGENDSYIAIYPLTYSETSTISWDDVLNSVMINKGDTSLPWEPYTGGVASPNPDYPQEIVSVGGASINLLDFYGENVIKGYYADSLGHITASTKGNDTWIVAVEPNTQYALSRIAYENMSSMRVVGFAEYPVINASGDVLASGDGTMLVASFRTLEDTKYIALYSDGLNQESGVDKGRLMLNEGDIPLPYVPYGTTVALRTHGKNLFDGRWRQGNSRNITEIMYVTSVISIPCKIGDVFSVSCQGMRVALFIVSSQAYVNPEGTIQSTGFVNDSATITCQHDGFVKIQMRKTDSSAITPVEAQSMEVMWNKGEAIPYEPYQESVAYLSETLRGIGDVKDRIVRKDGTWQIERNVREIVFDGDESWRKNSVYPDTTRGVDVSGIKSNCSLLSNKYVNQKTSGTVDGIYAASSINVTDMRYSTVEEFTASLAESPLIVFYELAEPTYESILESERDMFNDLKVYEGTTYLLVNSSVNPNIVYEYSISDVGAMSIGNLNDVEKLTNLLKHAVFIDSFDESTGLLRLKSFENLK